MTTTPSTQKEGLLSVLNDKMDALSIQSHSTTGKDLIDLEVPPQHMLETTRNLQSVLEESVSTLSFLKDMNSDQLYVNLNQTVIDLYNKVLELERIVTFYASESEQAKDDTEFSIDPALMKWLSDCLLCLLAFQANVDGELDKQSKALKAEMQDERQESTSTESSRARKVDWEEDDSWSLVGTDDGDEENSLVGHQLKLQDFIDRLVEFLPILIADLGEYHIAHSSFTTHGTSPALRALRYALYNLKDELSNLNPALFEYLQIGVETFSSQFDAIRSETLQLQYVVTDYLTNDGSDWLNSLLAGGLSFSQFRQISVTEVRDIAYSLEKSNDMLRDLNNPRMWVPPYLVHEMDKYNPLIALADKEKHNPRYMKKVEELLALLEQTLPALRQSIRSRI